MVSERKRKSFSWSKCIKWWRDFQQLHCHFPSTEPETARLEVTFGSWKLLKKTCCWNTRLNFFSRRIISRWNSLSQEDVNATPINSFNNRLERQRNNAKDVFKDRIQVKVLPNTQHHGKSILNATIIPGACAPGKLPGKYMSTGRYYIPNVAHIIYPLHSTQQFITYATPSPTLTLSLTLYIQVRCKIRDT